MNNTKRFRLNMSYDFSKYLVQAKLIRRASEQKWAALANYRMQGEVAAPQKEGDEISPSPVAPTAPPVAPVDDANSRKIEEQIRVLEATLAKEREARKASEAEAKKAHQYRTALGELDPTRLDEIHAALELQKKHEETLARTRSETASERDKFHEERIRAIEAEKQSVTESYHQLKKRLAIQRYFSQTEVSGRPSELDSFINLCGRQFEYDPVSDKIVKVTDPAGQEMFVGGKSATPVDLLLEMRKGVQGFAIQSCFVPYNQSSGGGLPITGANGQLIGDWKTGSKEQIAKLAFQQ
jgi:hypothetical protein